MGLPAAHSDAVTAHRFAHDLSMVAAALVTRLP
jgi:hypothetical protein